MTARSATVVFALSLAVFGRPAPARAVPAFCAQDSNCRAQVVEFQGEVAVKRAAAAAWTAPEINTTLVQGDLIRVGANGRIVLRMPNGATSVFDRVGFYPIPCT